MKFAKQKQLLELPEWSEFYVDYVKLKRIAEAFLEAEEAEEQSGSDDSVSQGTVTRAARRREATTRALAAAGGVEVARGAGEASFLSLAESELAKVVTFFGARAADAEARVAAAGELVAAASALVAADAVCCGGCGGGEEAGGGVGGSSGAPATAASIGAAVAAASAALLAASDLLDDLSGYAALNRVALEKAAKKFDKRWRALLGSAAGAGAAPPPPLAPRIAALLGRSALAGAPAALDALSSRCAALTLAMPPPLERRPSEAVGGAAALDGGGGVGGGGSARPAEGGAAVVKELDLDELPAGTVTRLRVRLAESALGEPIAVPVLVAKGAHAGPVLGITSAVRNSASILAPFAPHVNRAPPPPPPS
jgi:hypothetical protein